jgi:hypothetical protein
MVQVSIVMPKDHAANCCRKGTGHIKKASAPDDASSSPLSRFFLNVTRPIYTKLWPGHSSIMTSYLSSDLPSTMMLFTSTGILLWLPFRPEDDIPRPDFLHASVQAAFGFTLLWNVLLKQQPDQRGGFPSWSWAGWIAPVK